MGSPICADLSWASGRCLKLTFFLLSALHACRGGWSLEVLALITAQIQHLFKCTDLLLDVVWIFVLDLVTYDVKRGLDDVQPIFFICSNCFSKSVTSSTLHLITENKTRKTWQTCQTESAATHACPQCQRTSRKNFVSTKINNIQPKLPSLSSLRDL